MSGQVREALDAARNACQARHRAVYTFDVLLALLDMPGGRVRSCFEDVASGLSDRVRQGLLAMPDPGKQQHPFVPFEWVERDDMQLAWQYTLSDARPAVSDLHLLLAILDSQSETNLWLKRCLRHEHAQVRALTDGRRHSGPTTIKSPTPN
jgi:ATP-dependent Clp protease ATP-binding subunit ClpA